MSYFSHCRFSSNRPQQCMTNWLLPTHAVWHFLFHFSCCYVVAARQGPGMLLPLSKHRTVGFILQVCLFWSTNVGGMFFCSVCQNLQRGHSLFSQLLLTSCSAAFGQPYIRYWGSWMWNLPAFLKVKLMLFSHFSILWFSRGKGEELPSDDTLKFKIHFAVFTTSKQLSTLAFRIAVLQINITWDWSQNKLN